MQNPGCVTRLQAKKNLGTNDIKGNKGGHCLKNSLVQSTLTIDQGGFKLRSATDRATQQREPAPNTNMSGRRDHTPKKINKMKAPMLHLSKEPMESQTRNQAYAQKT